MCSKQKSVQHGLTSNLTITNKHKFLIPIWKVYWRYLPLQIAYQRYYLESQFRRLMGSPSKTLREWKHNFKMKRYIHLVSWKVCVALVFSTMEFVKQRNAFELIIETLITTSECSLVITMINWQGYEVCQSHWWRMQNGNVDNQNWGWTRWIYKMETPHNLLPFLCYVENLHRWSWTIWSHLRWRFGQSTQ